MPLFTRGSGPGDATLCSIACAAQDSARNELETTELLATSTDTG